VPNPDTGKGYIQPKPIFTMNKEGSLNLESTILLVIGALIVLFTGMLLLILAFSEDGNQNSLIGDLLNRVGGNQKPDDIPVIEPFEIVSSSPSGNLPSSARQVTLSVTTSKNAVCRYSLAANQHYENMPLTFQDTGEKLHTTTVLTLSGNRNYIFYIKCSDEEGTTMENDHTISFNIAGGPDDSAPAMFDPMPSGTLEQGETSTTISIRTDESASCKFSPYGHKKYEEMENIFTSTGNTAHAATLTGLNLDEKYEYFVKCRDNEGNINTENSVIRFFTSSIEYPVNVPFEGAKLSNGRVNGVDTVAYLPSGTTDLDFSLATDKLATCKYSTSLGTNYSNMSGSFIESDSLLHTVQLSGYSDDDAGAIYVRCEDEESNVNDSDYIIEYSIGQKIQLRIERSEDDTFDIQTGYHQNDSPHLTVGVIGSVHYNAYFRWKCLLPPKAIINEARLIVKPSMDYAGSPIFRIKLLDPTGNQNWERDDPPDNIGFSYSNYEYTSDLSSIPVTGSGVLWPVSDTWNLFEEKYSPDISDIVQEFVDRDDYETDNYIGLKIENTSGTSDMWLGRLIASYDYSSSYAAILEIDYSNPSNS